MVRGRLLVIGFLIAAAVTVVLVVSPGAGAQPPTAESLQASDVIPLPGICPFDITFTGTGTIELTTFYDNDGVPIRQSIHGALTHTVFSAWHTLVSNGPAPVHVDLTGGQLVETGKEFAFHVPGDGIVFGQSGRAVSTPDGTPLSFVGHSVLDAPGLCAALAP